MRMMRLNPPKHCAFKDNELQLSMSEQPQVSHECDAKLIQANKDQPGPEHTHCQATLVSSGMPHAVKHFATIRQHHMELKKSVAVYLCSTILPVLQCMLTLCFNKISCCM